MRANNLVDLDRNHLIHPAASWRGLPAATQPALNCTADQIDQIVDRTRLVLDATLDGPDIRAAMA